jgi:hypothetical protein
VTDIDRQSFPAFLVQSHVSSQFLEDHLFVLQPVATGQHQLSPRVVHLALQVRSPSLANMHRASSGQGILQPTAAALKAAGRLVRCLIASCSG